MEYQMVIVIQIVVYPMDNLLFVLVNQKENVMESQIADYLMDYLLFVLANLMVMQLSIFVKEIKMIKRKRKTLQILVIVKLEMII